MRWHWSPAHLLLQWSSLSSEHTEHDLVLVLQKPTHKQAYCTAIWKVLAPENQNLFMVWEEGDWENGWFYTFALEQFMGMVQTLVATQWCYQGWLDSVSGVSKVEVVILHSYIRPNLCPDGSWWNNLEWGQHSPSCTEVMLKRCFRLPVVNSMKIFFHLVLTRFMWITAN